MSIKGIFSSAKGKAQAIILGLKIAGIGFVLGLTVMNVIRKFTKDET